METTYNFNDLSETLTRLQRWANRQTILAQGQGLPMPHEMIEAAFKSARRRLQKHRGETSKYLPHQGNQEMARRVKQAKLLST